MLLAIDVHYENGFASVAGVCFQRWEDDKALDVLKCRIETPSVYLPGEFYRRELPCLTALIQRFDLSPDTVVIDGFVYLDGYRRPGLGKYLYDSLQGSVSVIGIAKSRFKDIGDEFAVFRGASTRPLYVTSAGVPVEDAKKCIEAMHGRHRIPTLLKLADSECKTV